MQTQQPKQYIALLPGEMAEKRAQQAAYTEKMDAWQ
jgi:hypothetical protein